MLLCRPAGEVWSASGGRLEGDPKLHNRTRSFVVVVTFTALNPVKKGALYPKEELD